MVTAAQIVVAAALALAWVWVLWRPVVHGLLGLFGRSSFDPFAIPPSDHAPAEHEAAFWGEEPRNARPPEIRRRQLMLATLLAWFVSFFLAIAFRGLLVWVFGVMTVLVVVHVSVAAYLGGRIIKARRDAFGQREALASFRATRIEADVVGPSEMHLLVQELQATYPLGPARPGAPAAGADPGPGSPEWRHLVAELIEREWGHEPAAPAAPAALDPAAQAPAATSAAADPPVAARPAAAAHPATGQNPRPAPRPADQASGAQPAPTPSAAAQPKPAQPNPAQPKSAQPKPAQPKPAQPKSAQPKQPAAKVSAGSRPDARKAAATSAPAASGAPVAESDPLFTRPASQAPARPRRSKPRPIYIHSQLDEEGFFPPRAVNDQ